MEHLSRPKQIAVDDLPVTVNKVNGRSASSDHTMRPLSSTVEDLCMKNGPARSKTGGDRATFHHKSKCVEQEVGTQSTSASVNTIWDTIRTRGRFFLRCKG